jgi:hypothetical protein
VLCTMDGAAYNHKLMGISRWNHPARDGLRGQLALAVGLWKCADNPTPWTSWERDKGGIFRAPAGPSHDFH